MTQSTPSTTPPARRRGLRGLLLGAAFAATFLTGGLIVTAAPALAAALEQTGMDAMGPMHKMHDHARLHAMFEAHLDKMLAGVDATPDQKARIKSILHRGFEQIGPIHEKLASAHGDLHRLLMAPTIDRAALEQLRAERMGDVDQASKAVVQTLADAAEVLSPEQRAKLGAMMAEHQRSHP